MILDILLVAPFVKLLLIRTDRSPETRSTSCLVAWDTNCEDKLKLKPGENVSSRIPTWNGHRSVALWYLVEKPKSPKTGFVSWILAASGSRPRSKSICRKWHRCQSWPLTQILALVSARNAEVFLCWYNLGGQRLEILPINVAGSFAMQQGELQVLPGWLHLSPIVPAGRWMWNYFQRLRECEAAACSGIGDQN